MSNAAAQRALAEKLLSEARQALNAGDADEARSLAHRAKGCVAKGEQIPGLVELSASLDSAEIIVDFGGYLERGGSAALERDELEREQRDVECEPRQKAHSRSARQDEEELDEAGIRHRRSLRRGKLVAGGIFGVVMTAMVANVVRVSIPDDDNASQQQCRPRARSVIAMPVLGGGPREPRLVTLDEIRRTFAEERIAAHRRQQNRQREVAALVTASAGGGSAATEAHVPAASAGGGGSAAAKEAHGHVPAASAATLTSVATSRTPPGLPSRSPHVYVPAAMTPTFAVASDAALNGRRAPAGRSQPAAGGRHTVTTTGASQATGQRVAARAGGRYSATGGAASATSARRGRRTHREHSSGRRRSRPAGGRYFATDTTTRVKAVRKRKQTPQLQLPVGTEIEAMLDLGISSVRHGEVLARVQRSVEHGKTRIPQGAMIVGQSENDAKRIYISFTKVLIDGRAYQIRAIAIEDKMRGLRPEKREATLEERQGAEFAKGALDIVGAVAKRGVGQLAGRAVDGVIGEAKNEHEVDRTVVLSVPAGKLITAKVLH